MILLIAILIIFAILSTKISARFGLPLLIGFILIGITFGSDVLNIFYFDDAVLAKRISEVLLIFIIFDGGFSVNKKSFQTVAGPALTLATFGVILTSTILGLFIHFILKFDLIYSFLISSIISSTDAAAVFMITKSNPIKDKLATTLNVESAANDPMAIILTITFIQLATKASGSLLSSFLLLLWQFFGGVIFGFVCYKMTKYIFKKLNSDNRGNYNVLMVGCLLLSYGIAELCHANGIIAVFFMGFWLGNSSFPAKKSVNNFLDSIATIFNIALFILLGLLAFPSRFIHIWKEALIIVGVMIFVARPLAVLLATLPFKYTPKEKTFVMWGGIKGAVPIVLATYPLAVGLDNDGFIFNTIFFAVFLSCILQGTTLGLLAKIFKFTVPEKPKLPHSVELHSIQKSDIDMYEITINENSNCLNMTLSEIGLGKEVSISSIIRNGQIVLPKGNTVILPNDILFVLAYSTEIESINNRINNYCKKDQMAPTSV